MRIIPVRWPVRLLVTLLASVSCWTARAQSLDLGQPPGAAPVPIQITADQGIEWQQALQTVTASGNAKAVRGAVTVTADQLIAHYRKKPGSPPSNAAAPAMAASGKVAPAGPAVKAPAAASAAAPPGDAVDELANGGAELYQLDAVGHVHIYTATDNAYGDHAVYNMDQGVLVLTGQALKLTTPADTVTAKNSIEYYNDKHQAIARGDALIVSTDGRSIAADILIGYLQPEADGAAAGAPAAPAKPADPVDPNDPLSQAGQLKKVDAIGHVTVVTPSGTATGNRGVYLPATGLARLGGNVHITRGGNTMAGSDAVVNLKTGIATLLAGRGGQVAGTILPGSQAAGPSK